VNRLVEDGGAAAFPADLSRAAVIIPALNEAASLARLLPVLRAMRVGQVLVCDNGSTDDTPAVAESHGAKWIFEPRRGYGSACQAGLRNLADNVEAVAFLDADMSDDPALLAAIFDPIFRGEADFVLGARVASLREKGAMTLPQAIGNRLVPWLIRIGWGHRYRDMGSLRAVRRSAIEAMQLRDTTFGWNIEMQVRAVELGLRIREIDVPYRRRRIGRSKISGTLRGVVLATWRILQTCGVMWWTRGQRCGATSS
jgi:glycosyltransferase involved in cell wall biosynthesis